MVIPSISLYSYETNLDKQISWDIWNHPSWVLSWPRSPAQSSHRQSWLHNLLWGYPLSLARKSAFLTPFVLIFYVSVSPPFLTRMWKTHKNKSEQDGLIGHPSTMYPRLNNNNLASVHRQKCFCGSPSSATQEIVKSQWRPRTKIAVLKNRPTPSRLTCWPWSWL